MNKNHSVSYTVPLEYAEIAENILIAHCVNGFEERIVSNGTTVFIIHKDDSQDEIEWHNEITRILKENCPIEVEYSVSDDISWVDKWKESCTPVESGKFYVVPGWYNETIPKGLYPLYITPRMAFGTGHHATTSLCLKAISSEYITPSILQGRFADIGTGSGILAMALARLGMQGIAIDIDPIAIENTKENIIRNTVNKVIQTAVGDITYLPKDEYYSCIVANILSEPLHKIAEMIAKVIEPNGICILSGILTIQMDAIIKRYSNVGFVCREIQHESEWSMCILSKTQ